MLYDCDGGDGEGIGCSVGNVITSEGGGVP